MCTHLIALKPIVLKSVIDYAQLCAENQAKNNSEIICSPFKSKINLFNAYNTNLMVK